MSSLCFLFKYLPSLLDIIWSISLVFNSDVERTFVANNIISVIYILLAVQMRYFNILVILQQCLFSRAER